MQSVRWHFSQLISGPHLTGRSILFDRGYCPLPASGGSTAAAFFSLVLASDEPVHAVGQEEFPEGLLWVWGPSRDGGRALAVLGHCPKREESMATVSWGKGQWRRHSGWERSVAGGVGAPW